MAAQGRPLAGARVLVVGVAYKKDSDDAREAPGVRLLRLLRDRGAETNYNDPHVPRLPATLRPELRLDSVPLTEDFMRAQDCVLVVTDHSAYDWDWVVGNAALVVDTRNATRDVTRHRERICKA